MTDRFGLLCAMTAAMLLACAGVVLAQPARSLEGEELVADASSLEAGEVIPGSYIVVLEDGVDPQAVVSDLTGRVGLEVIHVYRNALDGFAVRTRSGLDLPALLQNDDRVEFVARDRAVEAAGQKTPTGIRRIEADLSSARAGNGRGSVDEDIAILDTGIYRDHRDLRVRGGYNCTGKNRKAYSDANGHGTHVAGSAAARDNAIGVVGAAPGARLWAVKVLGKGGKGSVSSIICGVDWVTGKNTSGGSTNDIEVANISLGAPASGFDNGACGWTGDNSAAALHRAICNSVQAGVTYTASAGNDSMNFEQYIPAAFDQVLTVTAMADFDGKPGGRGDQTCRKEQDDDTAANFSNYTTRLGSDDEHTIAAPGVCIRSTWTNGNYRTLSGTSMAAPHAAGTSALCIASGECPRLSPSQVIDKLRADAEQRSDTSESPYYGFRGDPNDPISLAYYYGYLAYAGGY